MSNFGDTASKIGNGLKPIFKFLGKSLVVIAAAGAYDVSRNKAIDESTLKRYFFGNGAVTWLLSPINTLLDILSLPFVNKGIYQLEDLPKDYQAEIKRLIEISSEDDVVAKLETIAKERSRSMFFFKWYGDTIDNGVDIPGFHEPFKYIRTIGVSVFNKKQSTSKHYGPFRATLRVLYNINEMKGEAAYIEVGDVKHYWSKEKLFIFDDTLQHQSFNESDELRYCLFVDILRPSLIPAFFDAVVSLVRLSLRSVNFVFYKNWDVIKA